MTNKEAVKELIDMANALYLNPDTPQGIALKMAIKALEQEPCEDTISRQATLEPYKRLKDTDTLCVALIRANIMQQPSIKPQEPRNTKCDRCPYGETKVVNICNYDGDGCGWE